MLKEQAYSEEEEKSTSPPVGLYDLRNKINQNKNNKIKNHYD